MGALERLTMLRACRSVPSLETRLLMITPLRALGIALALGLPIAAFAADHQDSPTAMTNEPTADITDLYAWMTSDATKLNLVAAVDSDAGEEATFSDAV